MRQHTDEPLRLTVLLKLREDVYAPDRRTLLAVVRWNDYPPTLERRDWFLKRGLRCGRRKGLLAKDFVLVMDRAEEVADALAERGRFARAAQEKGEADETRSGD